MPATFSPTKPPQAPLRTTLGTLPPKPPKPPFAKRLLGWLSGFGLATILLVILGLLTWLATLEQIDQGLHATLRKYFDWRAVVVIPKLGNELIPLPLPGGYWTCVMLFINLALGGIFRMRKGLRQVGVLISHAGILMLLIAGAVAFHSSERGHMLIPEGGSSNVAEDYHEATVEIAEVKDGKPVSIHVIRGRYLTDLTDSRIRSVELPGLPFDMDLAFYQTHAEIKAIGLEPPPPDVRAIDGFYISPQPGELNAERNTPACIARIVRRDGTKEEPFMLSTTCHHPFTVRQDDRVFTIALRKRQWVMPFTVRLDKFTAGFYPGTMKPSEFISEITRSEGGTEVEAVIQMNEPMRYAGRTFYQASYQQLGTGPSARMASVFEVVSNPADQWPLYSLCVVTIGLLLHFILRLIAAIQSYSRRQPDV